MTRPVAGDTDYYFIDLVRGTDVAFRVDAARYGGPLNSMMGLLDGDGRTLLAVNDEMLRNLDGMPA